MRAFLSLVIAVVASAVGDLLLWGGGSSLLTLQQRVFLTQPGQVVLPSILLVLGLICLAGAMLTAGWSSLGVIVVGIVQTLAGLAIVTLPAGIYVGTLASVDRISRPVGDGLFAWLASGIGLVTGLVFLVGGIAIATRTPRSGAAGRLTTAILSIVLGSGLVLLIALGGARVIRAIQLAAGGIELLGVLLVLVAALLTVVVVGGIRFSSLGALILGVLILGLGGLLVWAPQLVLRALQSNPAVAVGLGYAGGGGGYLALGALVLVAGIAGMMRARRKRAAEPALDVDERIGYQAEQPVDTGFPFPSLGDPAATAPDRDERPVDRV